jgi:hypothetical protein
MKIVGTGAPIVLTMRFEPCELELLIEQLVERPARVMSSSGSQAAGHRPYLRDARLDDISNDLEETARALDQLSEVDRGEPRAFEVTGPSSFWTSVIRRAAGEASTRFADAMRRFTTVGEECTREELQIASAVTAAWTETLIALHYVDNHGLED